MSTFLFKNLSKPHVLSQHDEVSLYERIKFSNKYLFSRSLKISISLIVDMSEQNFRD